MEGVTLLESKTARAHFAFVKRLEASKSAKEADLIVQKTIGEVKETLQSKSVSALSESTIFSQLLVLLHCLQLYPHSSESDDEPNFDLSFALVPTLHLLATTEKSNGLKISYSMLAYLLGPHNVSDSSSDLQSSSLLVLNTIRQHLGSKPTNQSAHKITSQNAKANSIRYTRQYYALRSIITGTPAGADAVPALYGPVFALINHPDDGIKASAIEALLVLNSYRHEEEGQGIAKATFDQIRDVVMGSVSRSKKGKGKEQSKRSTKHDYEGLQRAFIKASNIAITQKIITLDVYVDLMTSIIEPQSTNWLKLYMIRSLTLQLSKESGGVQSSTIDKIWDWISTNCIAHLNHNPLLLDVAKLIGSLKSHEVVKGKETILQTIWPLIMEHLTCRNANRRILSLDVLSALIPYQWNVPSSPVQLNEEQMKALMEMLGDIDDTIRKRALGLLYKIEKSIISAQLEALQSAAGEVTKTKGEASNLILRACECLQCLCQANGEESFSNSYAPNLAKLLQISHIQDTIDEQVVHQVTRDWCNAPLHNATEAVSVLCAQIVESKQTLSPTSSLLLATLICELFDATEDDRIRSTYASILGNMSLLQAMNGEKAIALQEAMLIACIKLTALSKKIDVENILPLFAKTAEAASSSLIKERAGQIEKVASSENVEDLASVLKRASLLSTLDRIDSFITNGGRVVNGKGTAIKNKSRAPPKPLQYDAYESPIAADTLSAQISSSSSSSFNQSSKKSKPFHALPTPSQMRKQTLSERKRHEAIEQVIHKSIAQMTLGEEETEARTEYDTTNDFDEEEVEVQIQVNRNSDDGQRENNIPKEGVFF